MDACRCTQMFTDTAVTITTTTSLTTDVSTTATTTTTSAALQLFSISQVYLVGLTQNSFA